MPTYKADIEWLRQTHPEEYAKIPVDYLDDRLWKQQHGSFVADSGRENWVISFYPGSPTADGDGIDVELEIPRPAPDMSPDYCPDHTLDVSRTYCSCASK